MKRKMTKQQAEQQFKRDILPLIKEEEYNGKDSIRRAQEWGFFIDSLCKDGLITLNQYHEWDSPKVCQ